MREFETGATRDADDTKLDYEGFLAPMVLARFAQYMHQHRIQANGEVRDSDNWQKGIPKDAYMKSLWRHFMELWVLHRAGEDISHEQEIALQEALCAIMFNVMGYLFEEVYTVGMHLPGQPDDPSYEEDPKLVTMAPAREPEFTNEEILQGLDPLEAEEQVRPKDSFPCSDPNMEYHAGGDYFIPKHAPTNTGKGTEGFGSPHPSCCAPGCKCSTKPQGTSRGPSPYDASFSAKVKIPDRGRGCGA